MILSSRLKLVDILLLFEMHQPRRLKRQFGRLSGQGCHNFEESFFDDELNREILQRVAERSYLPMLKMLSARLKSDRFRCSVCASGTLLDQCNMWNSAVLSALKEIRASNRCEFIAEPYFRSISSILEYDDFSRQIAIHRKVLKELLNYDALTARNTGWIYDNGVGETLSSLGFKAGLVEGSGSLLGWRSPNYLYASRGGGLKLIARDYRLSDIINYRLCSSALPSGIADAEALYQIFAGKEGDLVLVSFNMETFGERYSDGNATRAFLEKLLDLIESNDDLRLSTPLEACQSLEPRGELEGEQPTSSADLEKDLSAWASNPLQKYCLDNMKYLYPLAKSSGGKALRAWRLLCQADFYEYMSMKGGETGAIHSSYSHFSSPLEAFLTFNWTLTDYRQRLYSTLGENARYYRMLYGELPESHSFHFYKGFGAPSGIVARNLEELKAAIGEVPAESIAYHLGRRDLGRWILEILGCQDLAKAVDRLSPLEEPEAMRGRLLAEIEKAMDDARKRLGAGEKDANSKA